MKYEEFVEKVSKKSGNTKVATREVLEAFKEVISQSLKEGEGVTIPNLGKFHTKYVPGHEKTSGWGKTYQVDSHYRPRFNFSVSLKKDMKDRT